VSALDDLPLIPGERRRGLRIASVALLIAVLAAGGLIAAYLIHVGGSSDASATTTHTTGPTTQPVGTSGSTVAAPTLTPVKLADVTSYDPQGDGSESQYLAPAAIDGNPATAWRTETYKGQANDLAGKQGVGLVLDAGRAVSARALRISTPQPGWEARVFSTRAAAIPSDLTGWSAASASFAMTGASRKVVLQSPPARFFLLWITKLTGQPGAWSASVSNVALLASAQ
jgi:hypothetical protein